VTFSRYLLLAPLLLLVYVGGSFAVGLIFDGHAAIETFGEDLKFRLFFGVAWVVFLFIVGLKNGKIIFNRQKASASAASRFLRHDRMMKVNWTRGLLRLWLVASLLWAAPMGWLAWPDWNYGERASWWATYTFAPPIVVLIVGISLLWTLRGFRQTP
jgi:hypothetical protein